MTRGLLERLADGPVLGDDHGHEGTETKVAR